MSSHARVRTTDRSTRSTRDGHREALGKGHHRKGGAPAEKASSGKTLARSFVRYIQTSALLFEAPQPLPPITKKLERRLAADAGVAAALPFRANDFRNLAENDGIPYQDLPSLVNDMRGMLRMLQAAGLEILVVDSLEYLATDQADHFIFAVMNLWSSGLDVVLLGPDNAYVSFDEIAEVVTGKDFIRIYINSFLRDIRSRSRRHRQQAALRRFLSNA